MTYDEIIDHIFTLRGRESSAVAPLCAASLGQPQCAYPTIHVAGTNGKGSVCHKIARALSIAGYRVGLYTSPHIHSYRERISINGELVSKEDVVSGFNRLLSLQNKEKIRLGFFTLTTLLAFEYFREMRVDIAVIETGIGGRIDPTNIVTPILSVITSIGKDHPALLGESLEEIAKEKAGIIKRGTPVVVGSKAHFRAIEERALALSAPFHGASGEKTSFDLENQATARLSLSLIAKDFPLDTASIERGISERPPFRLMQRGRIIFDVAHNLDGFFRLIESLHSCYRGEMFRFIFATKKEKDFRGILKEMSMCASHIHLVEEIPPEKSDIKEMENVLIEVNDASFSSHTRVEEALECALDSSDMIVICGSFFLMHPAYASLEKRSQHPLFLDTLCQHLIG